MTAQWFVAAVLANPTWWVAGALLVISALYAVAEAEGLPGCAECGRPAGAPLHWSCTLGIYCTDRKAHHEYRAPDWPWVLLTVLMAADLAIVAAGAFGL